MALPTRSPCILLSALIFFFAPETGAEELPRQRQVQDVQMLKRQGARVAWSPQGDWLAFDRADPTDGLYDLYVMKLDGTGERCLTCRALEFRKSNNLNPSWHASGEYLVFQVQRRAKRLHLDMEDLATPHRALHSDLWLIRRDGLRFWRLTRSEERGGAVLDPHFSHEGSQLMWSERVGTRHGRWGEWALRVARFTIKANPRIGKVRSYRPGERRELLVSHGFTPNDRGAVVSGNFEPGHGEAGMDVYVLDLEDGELTRLTHSLRGWDGYAHFAPRGERIAWTSDAELPRDSKRLAPATRRDLWVMNADGSQKDRLTFFNHPASPESLGEAYLGDFDWSPRGDQIAIHVIYDPRNGGEGIYLIQLDPSYRR